MTRTKKNRFGHGKVKYHNAQEFPSTIEYNGCFWYRTAYGFTFVETGMEGFEYGTYDREEDLRLYVDAAGNIWDEKELGIL